MQNINEKKLKKFEINFNSNLKKTAEELFSGLWEIYYDKKNDEFFWKNPNLTGSEDSLLFSVDSHVSVSLNKKTAEIEYIQFSYLKEYAKKNPEFKSLVKAARRICKKSNKIDGATNKTIEVLVGKLLIAQEPKFAFA